MTSLMNFFGIQPSDKKQRDKLANMMKVDKDLLAKFEAAYQKSGLDIQTGNLFDYANADAIHQAPGQMPDNVDFDALTDIMGRIVQELIDKTPVIHVLPDGTVQTLLPEARENTAPVTSREINQFPDAVRPQLTGSLMKLDVGGGPSWHSLAETYGMYQKARDVKTKTHLGFLLRQGLDILDLDPVLYEMLGHNPNSMSHWLPAIARAIKLQDFLKLPETRIARVPLPLLQLTRIEYGELTQTTKHIVDRWAEKTFALDDTRDYFVKTGTFSSKFDFRNAHVPCGNEIHELGEYLLLIQNQACVMAGPLTQPSITGASTTNEFVVREFIHDKENNPCIYKGLPLHTEYRVFVDFDEKTILGISPYWRADLMLKRFGDGAENSPHDYHDYVIYKAHEDVLNGRYEANKDRVLKAIADLLPNTDLTGQWSIDIMQNGDDFYLIDMALAVESAMNDVVPKNLLKPVRDPWLAEFPEMARKAIEG